jgi:hypothetical protein
VAYSNGVGVRQIWAGGQVIDVGGWVTSAPALVEWPGGTSTWTLARGTDNALWVNFTSGAGASSAWYRVGGILA